MPENIPVIEIKDEDAKRTLLRRKVAKKETPVAEETKQELYSITDQDLIELYESLLHVFSSRDHLIVGRDAEGNAIKEFIDDNIKNDVSGLLYVCGHPG